MVKFFPAFHSMKDIITTVRSDIVHDFKQFAIPIKANKQILILILWQQTVNQGERQGLKYIFLGYILVF